jgi:sterol 3beta-glucosyltransferase
MKITINTFGTRGDIQPYIALGKGLKQAGHAVCIFTHQIFESFVREHGLGFYPLQLDPRQVLINQAVSELGNNVVRMHRWLEKNFKLELEDLFIATLDANRDADVMLNTGLSFAGWHVAEKLGIPAIATYLWPATPSRYIPPTLGKAPQDWLPFKGTINYWSTKLSNQMFFGLLRSAVDQCRKDILDLRPMKFREYWSLDSPESSVPIVYGYSPVVIPKPPDWGPRQQVSGYWFLESEKDYEPDESLRGFLASGPPPIYIGFGSMVEHEREEIIQIVVEALSEINQRGILLSGWSALESRDLPDSILVIKAAPHDWLFPQTAAVVHHGGAGTTAAGLYAGKPSVVVPSFGDQFFWGWRVNELGVGPKPIHRNKLTVDKLAEAINQAVKDDAIRNNAIRIGQQIRAENGVESAVRMIETFVRYGHF